VVDKKPDGADMVIQLFGKCQRLPDQTRHPVTQGVVEAFDVVGKAAVFTCRDVAVFGEDLGIGLPIVRVADGRLAVGFSGSESQCNCSDYALWTSLATAIDYSEICLTRSSHYGLYANYATF